MSKGERTFRVARQSLFCLHATNEIDTRKLRYVLHFARLLLRPMHKRKNTYLYSRMPLTDRHFMPGCQ
jgi:hypothetical protein